MAKTIGIDLGATNSVVSVLRHRISVVPFEDSGQALSGLASMTTNLPTIGFGPSSFAFPRFLAGRTMVGYFHASPSRTQGRLYRDYSPITSGLTEGFDNL